MLFEELIEQFLFVAEGYRFPTKGFGGVYTTSVGYIQLNRLSFLAESQQLRSTS